MFKSNVSFFDGSDKEYVIYLLTFQFTVRQEVLKQNPSAISSPSDGGQGVVKELCQIENRAILQCFSEVYAEAAVPHLATRRKYLRKVLERLSEEVKTALMSELGEKSANYLRMAILKAQIATYEKKQEGAMGVFRIAGSVVGVSDSQRKKEFLQDLARHFSAKYFGTSNVGLVKFDDESRRETLRDVILPGEETLKTLSWLQDDYLMEIGVAEVMKYVPIKSVDLGQLLRRMTIRAVSLKDSETLICDYLHYICCSEPEVGDSNFTKGQDAVLKVPNLGEIVLKVLPAYQEQLKNFAEALSNEDTDEIAHKRIKRLRDMLEALSPENKIQLMQNLGEECANYLRVAILRSQYITYWNGLQGAKGVARDIGEAAGISQSKEKAVFLRNIAWDFAYQYNISGGVLIEMFKSFNDETWQNKLCNTILPESVATLQTLQWLPKEYLDQIGVTLAIETIKKNAEQMSAFSSALQQLFNGFTVVPSHRSSCSEETPLAVELKVNDRDYVRIKRKLDGKNKGTYDGTYVTKEAYDRVLPEENKTKLSSYVKGEVFFLKMFPFGKKMVEGFAEAFVGRLIEALIAAGLIEAEYVDCFAPASIIDLPNQAGPALWQPFALGAKLLYQCADDDLEAKPFFSEASGILLGTGGYERYLQALPHQRHTGLSFIVMFMIWVANYSVHSGNILVTLKNDMNLFMVIDYGAALRNFMGTKNQNDIWVPLETQLGLMDSSGNGALRLDKHYVRHYQTIPGFLNATVAHATTLSVNLLKKGQQFSSIVTQVTQKIYTRYMQAVTLKGEETAVARDHLFSYIYGECYDDISSSLNDMQNEALTALLSRAIFKVMVDRLKKIASYKEPVHASDASNVSRYASIRIPGTVFFSTKADTGSGTLPVTEYK